jgi:hypothetical protein
MVSALLLAAVRPASAVTDIYGFEPPDWTIGGAAPSGWTCRGDWSIVAGGTEGAQCLQLGYSNTSAYVYKSLSIAPSGVVTLGCDIRPMAYDPMPDGYNFVFYGEVAIYNNYPAREAGVVFSLENWSFVQPPPAESYKVYIRHPSGDVQVGTFSPTASAWYRYTATFDWAKNTLTQKVETADGVPVGNPLVTTTAGYGLMRFQPAGVSRPGYAAQFDRVFITSPDPPFAAQDLAKAAGLAAGTAAVSPSDLARFDVVKSGDSAGRVDMLDVAGIARRVAGLDANP